jgi:hypothetical protein
VDVDVGYTIQYNTQRQQENKKNKTKQVKNIHPTYVQHTQASNPPHIILSEPAPPPSMADWAPRNEISSFETLGE